MMQKRIMQNLMTLFPKIKSLLQKYSLVLLGLVIVILFIWFRYIRTRLSKDIPLSYLSAKGFLIITIICVVYILVIKGLLRPNSKKTILSEYIVPMLYLPLEHFDEFIKEPLNKEKIIVFMANKLSYIIKDTPIFYIIFAIIPRMILVSVLMLDVFYFQKLHYIYYFIYLTIFLFLNKYIIYSFKTEKKRLIEETKILLINESINTPYVPGVHPDDDPNDEDYDPFTPSMNLPLELFVDFQIKSILLQNSRQNFWFSLSEKYYAIFKIKHGIPLKEEIRSSHHWDIIRKDMNYSLKEKITKIIDLGCTIEYYNITHHQNMYFKFIKIVIFSTYLICWAYILIKSLPNLDKTSFIALSLYFSRMDLDPFISEIEFIPSTKKLTKSYITLCAQEGKIDIILYKVLDELSKK